MRKDFRNLILVGLCLLIFALGIGHFQAAEEWYEAGRIAFEGPRGDGGVKKQIRETEAQLNDLLKPDMLQEIFSEQAEWSLDDFFLKLAGYYTEESTESGQEPEVEDNERVTINQIKESYIRIGQRLDNNVLDSLNRATDMNPEYTDAYLKKAEVYLAMHLEQKAVEEFEKARAIMDKKGLQNVMFHLEQAGDSLETAEDEYQPLRDLVYKIAAIYLQGQILPGPATVKGDPGRTAARDLIADFHQFKTGPIDQDSADELDEDDEESEARRILGIFEIVRFYYDVGWKDQASDEYKKIKDEQIQALPKYLKDTVNEVKKKLDPKDAQVTKVFLPFRITEVPARIRLAPVDIGGFQRSVDYLAISYEELGTKVRLVHQIETVAGREHYRLILEEDGTYRCFLDIPEVIAPSETLLPVRVNFIRGSFSEDIVKSPLDSTQPRFTFTRLTVENPKPFTLTPTDFDEGVLLENKFVREAVYKGQLESTLILDSATSYNFILEVEKVPLEIPAWLVTLVLHTAAAAAAVFTF